MSKKYELVIGLEVHIELKTNTKIFCACKAIFGSEPNTNICPICLGLPGALPSLNETVVEYAILAGLSTNCSIRSRGRQDRKNYFYPDSPKAYQISQDDLPICYDGYLDISSGGKEERIGIERIHIEEDAGKLIHDELGTLIDFNRAGVPLIEIVTYPSLKDEEQVISFLQALRDIMIFTGISDAKMNEGSFRCDVNISLKEEGEKVLGSRVEVKNLNSFNSIRRSINYERERQEGLLKVGESVVQETRGYYDSDSTTYSMREEAQGDYRYLPDPDLAPIIINKERINKIKEELPELPDARKDKYMEKYGLNSYDAGQVTISKKVSDYFEECMKFTSSSKRLVNVLTGEIFNLTDSEDFQVNIPAQDLGELVNLLEEGRISNSSSKKIIRIMNSSGGRPEKIIKDKDLWQINDIGKLDDLAGKVLAGSVKAVKEYKAGRKESLEAIMGKIMRESKGLANPKKTRELLKEKLDREY